MTMTGTLSDGAPFHVCPEGARLFDAWLKSDWQDTPRGEDVFDNPEGRAYWAHRETCPDCTKRKGMNDGKS